MKMDRVMIQLPKEIKAKLDDMRRQGTTASGYIRSLLMRELDQAPSGAERTVNHGTKRRQGSRHLSA